MRVFASLFVSLFVSTAAFADAPAPLVAGGAAGPSSVDPVPEWSGPNAVDFAGDADGAHADSSGHLAYRLDRIDCGEQIGKLGRHWDTGGILRMTAQGGVQGAAEGAPAAAINPLVVPIGAIAGAGSQLFNAVTNNLGFFHNDAEAQITVCMRVRGMRNLTYTVTQ